MTDWFEIPEVYPEIDITKWYYLTVQAYEGGVPPWTCESTFVGVFSMCQSGANLQIWLDNNWQCTENNEIVHVDFFTAQRLIGVIGPYADFAACAAAHP